MKKTVNSIRKTKISGRKIVMLTAYDYPTALILNQAEIDIILVGDTLGMVVLGYETTRDVTVTDMIHHTSAVKRGNETCLIVSDLPYQSDKTSDLAVENAKQLISTGADAVKIEGNKTEIIGAIINEGIPVMGHVGLLPQTTETFRVRGRTKEKQIKFWKMRYPWNRWVALLLYWNAFRIQWLKESRNLYQYRQSVLGLEQVAMGKFLLSMI